MALIVGENSFLSVADAIEYFNNRPFSDEFLNADTSKQEKALIQATKLIDVKKFLGNRTSSTQKLSFPRTDLYIDNILQDNTIIPQRVKDATCELAIYTLQEDYSAPDDLADFENIKVGPVSVKTNAVGSRLPSGIKEFPPLVNELLKFATASTFELYRG